MTLEQANHLASIVSAGAAFMSALIAFSTYLLYRTTIMYGPTRRPQTPEHQTRSRRGIALEPMLTEVATYLIVGTLPVATGALFLLSRGEQPNFIALFSKGELALIGAGLLASAIPRTLSIRMSWAVKYSIVISSVIGFIFILLYNHILHLPGPLLSISNAAKMGVSLYLYSSCVHLLSIAAIYSSGQE
jgi:hypothetical protein